MRLSNIETQMARLKLRPEWKPISFEELPWAMICPPYVLVDGKLHRLHQYEAVGAVLQHDRSLVLSMIELVVPSRFDVRYVANQVAYLFAYFAAEMAMVSIALGTTKPTKSVIVDYELSLKFPKGSGTVQYSVALMVRDDSGSSKRRVTRWIDAHWRFDRVVVIGLDSSSFSVEGLRRYEKTWKEVQASFEWKPHTT